MPDYRLPQRSEICPLVVYNGAYIGNSFPTSRGKLIGPVFKGQEIQEESPEAGAGGWLAIGCDSTVGSEVKMFWSVQCCRKESGVRSLAFLIQTVSNLWT
jgi:hypothetical protein